jgi:hypothetical protein
MPLPDHGPIVCRRCWPEESKENVFVTADRQFRIVNDPGAWLEAASRTHRVKSYTPASDVTVRK